MPEASKCDAEIAEIRWGGRVPQTNHMTQRPASALHLREFPGTAPTAPPLLPICNGRFLRFPADTRHEQTAHRPWESLISGVHRPILMDLGYRNHLAPNGPHLIPPSDFRSPRLSRPPPVLDELHRSPDSGEMEKVPPVTGKRRGGCRKACNECKQQKVRATATCNSSLRAYPWHRSRGYPLRCRSPFPVWVHGVLAS